MNALEPTEAPTAAPKQLLVLWQHRALRSTVNHRYAGERCHRWQAALTFINAIGAIIVLSLTLLPPSPLLPTAWPWLITGSSVLIVVTSIVQMLSSFGERSNAHHYSAKNYAAIERKIHECIIYEKFGHEVIQHIRQALDNAAQGSPAVSSWLWGKDLRAQELNNQILRLEATLFPLPLGQEPNEKQPRATRGWRRLLAR